MSIEFEVKTKEVGGGLIELHEESVKIVYPFRETIYHSGTHEHAVISLVFEEASETNSEEDNDALARLIANIEMIPPLCYQDSELAHKMIEVVEMHLAEKIAEIAESEIPEDDLQEAKDMIMLEVDEMLNADA